jgi:F-type H+-transporting ATPase subunit delta
LKDTTVAARYARALFIVTEKRGETDRALEEMRELVRLIHHATTMGSFLVSPEVRLAEKRDVMRRALESHALGSVTLFVDLLLRKKRLREFTTIAEEFEALVEQARGIKRAHLVSAIPLHADETRRLHETLEQYTRSQIKLTSEVDPALLGGALVRIGDRVVDRSVRTLLEGIAKQLHEASV